MLELLFHLSGNLGASIKLVYEEMKRISAKSSEAGMATNELQSNSIIVDSIIVENSKIVDNLPATKDFYSIKIHNSRNSKIVEFFVREVARNLVFFQLFLPLFSARMFCIHI